MSAIDEGGPDGSVSGPSFHPTGHSADVQQLDRPMPEEVRPQYKDAVTKPLDSLRAIIHKTRSDNSCLDAICLLVPLAFACRTANFGHLTTHTNCF